MSKLTELLDELCPDGVEYRPFSEVIERLRTGLNPRKNFILNSPGSKNYYITVRELGGFNIETTEKTDLVNDAGLQLIQNRSGLRKGDVLFSGTGTIGRTALVSTEPKDWNIKEGVYALTPDHSILDSQFLVYALNSSRFQNAVHARAAGGTVKSISMKNLSALTLPVPPLEVQQEIARVLDAFTDLEQSLVSELELRKKQFDSVRRSVISDSQAAEKKVLRLREAESEGIVTLGRGKVISKKDIAANPGDYPVYSSSGAGNGEFGRYGNYMFDDERISWSVDGGGRLFYRPAHRYSVTNVSGWMTVNISDLQVKYLYYVLLSQWENESFDYTRKAHPSVIREVYAFSIPTIEIQDEVVSKLDSLESLIQSIEQEISLRRKQYEFYRDELLSFTPKKD